jgi:predicted nucleic acid-binding protein
VDLTVALDTNIFINVKNREEPYYKYSRSIIEAVDGGRIRALISAVVVAEMCTGYYMFGDIEGKQEFLSHIMASPYYEIVNVEVKVADLAGKVRAETGMRLPDAILVASALTREAYALVTHDDELKRAERLLKVMSAKELIGEMGRA